MQMAAVLLLGSMAVNPLKVLKRDWMALNARSTARHILRPPGKTGFSECTALKQEIASAVQNGEFVVDAFARVACEHSLDGDTRDAGGLLGERMRQGWVRDASLDRACFVSPLGVVAGPIESAFGWHLVLVEERIGCRLDNGMTRVVPRIVPGAENGVRETAPFVRSALDEGNAEAEEREVMLRTAQAAAATGALWFGANLVGGSFASGAAQVLNAAAEGSASASVMTGS